MEQEVLQDNLLRHITVSICAGLLQDFAELDFTRG
jgi:hypothetical protein